MLKKALAVVVGIMGVGCASMTTKLTYDIHQVSLHSQKVLTMEMPKSIHKTFSNNRPDWFTHEHELLLNAMAFVESSYNPMAIGDDGRSHGQLQIGNLYWIDATEHNQELLENDETFPESLYNPEYSREVVIAYWDRYGSRVDYSLEGLARMHNGGPNGHEKAATESYWNAVQEVYISLNADI